MSKEKKSSKTLLYTVIAVLFLFGLVFGASYYYNSKATGYVTLDEMIDKTLQGEETTTNYVYNGFAFVKEGTIWYTEVQVRNNIYIVFIGYFLLGLSHGTYAYLSQFNGKIIFQDPGKGAGM